MSLRLRLIVAFFLFSVVPLAAVTFYSYTSNLRALQVAAQHETEMLTGELTQRMQVVTTQISERVEHLMDMPAAAATTAVTGTTGRSRSSAPTGSKPTVVARATPAPAVAPPAAPAAPSTPSSPATSVTLRGDRSEHDGGASCRRARRSRDAAQQRRGARRRQIRRRCGRCRRRGQPRGEPFRRARCCRMARWRREDEDAGEVTTGAAVRAASGRMHHHPARSAMGRPRHPARRRRVR